MPGPLQPPSAEPEPAGPPVLPDELAVLRGARGGIARELAADVASDGVRPPGERLLALRQLEAGAETSARAVEVAEAMVMSGGDRQLAVNALGVLARAPEGRAALARCAASAPSPDLRDAARVLLARRG